MAQATLSSGNYCQPFRSPWGAFPTRGLVPISTATIQIGRPVTLLGTATTSFSQVIGVAANTPNMFLTAGIAAEAFTFASSATTPNAISVWEANPMIEFKAVTKGGAQASSNVGLRKSLVFDSTLNIAWVDMSASTATDWRVTVTQNLGTDGDSGGYVAFRFIPFLAGNANSTIMSSSPLLAFY